MKQRKGKKEENSNSISFMAVMAYKDQASRPQGRQRH